VSVPLFVQKISDYVNSNSALPYVVTTTSNANGNKVVEITFPDQASQQKAVNMPQPQKDSMNIIAAAAVDVTAGPGTTAAAAAAPAASKIPIPLIAGIVGGVVVLIIIIVIVVKKRASASSSHNRSGAVNLNYNALMADTFDGQELHSPRESYSVQV
jgi:hypothetical protein